MSGADLRNDIAGCLDLILGDDPHPAEQDTIDALLALLADPVRRLAILNLVGEVHKGRWVQNPIDPPGYGHVKVTPDGVQSAWHGFDVLVVRPRAEAEFICPTCGYVSADGDEAAHWEDTMNAGTPCPGNLRPRGEATA